MVTSVRDMVSTFLCISRGDLSTVEVCALRRVSREIKEVVDEVFLREFSYVLPAMNKEALFHASEAEISDQCVKRIMALFSYMKSMQINTCLHHISDDHIRLVSCDISEFSKQCLNFEVEVGFSEEKAFLKESIESVNPNEKLLSAIRIKNAISFKKMAFCQIEKLDLSRRSINVISTFVLLFENLDSLDLSKNQIAYVPPFLTKLSKLHFLDLSSNNLLTIPSLLSKNKICVDLFSNPLYHAPVEGGCLIRRLGDLLFFSSDEVIEYVLRQVRSPEDLRSFPYIKGSSMQDIYLDGITLSRILTYCRSPNIQRVLSEFKEALYAQSSTSIAVIKNGLAQLELILGTGTDITVLLKTKYQRIFHLADPMHVPVDTSVLYRDICEGFIEVLFNRVSFVSECTIS